MKLASFSLGLAGFALSLAATSAGAIDKCKAKIDRKTGEILFSAKNASGTPLWGGSTDGGDFPATPFADHPACVKGTALRNCHVGAPGTPSAKRPPAACTLTVQDNGGQCTSYIQGCVASSILWAAVRLDAGVPELSHGLGVLSVVHDAAGETHVTFDRNIQRCAISIAVQQGGGIPAAAPSDTNEVRVLTFVNGGSDEPMAYDLVMHCP